MEPWIYYLGFVFLIGVSLCISIFVLIPKAVSHFASWKITHEERYLGQFFTDLVISILLISGSVFILIKNLPNIIQHKTSYFSLLTIVLTTTLLPLSTAFFAPKAVHHYLIWKKSNASKHLILFSLYTVIAFILISVVFVIFFQLLIKY